MTDNKDTYLKPAPLSAEADKARKRRNVWLALTLVGFVILIMLITALRLKANLAAGA